jgi:hypothetical protein
VISGIFGRQSLGLNRGSAPEIVTYFSKKANPSALASTPFALPTMNTLSPIERIPFEIVQEIATWASSPFTISQLSWQLRCIALDTPALWQEFYTTCRVYQTGNEFLVGHGYLEHIDRWYARLGNKNELAVKFTLKKLWRRHAPEGCVTFDQQAIESFFCLFARAHYLYIEHNLIFFLKYASGLPLTNAPWPFIESLTIIRSLDEVEDLSYNHTLDHMLEKFKMAALRRVHLGQLSLTYPLNDFVCS